MDLFLFLKHLANQAHLQRGYQWLHTDTDEPHIFLHFSPQYITSCYRLRLCIINAKNGALTPIQPTKCLIFEPLYVLPRIDVFTDNSKSSYTKKQLFWLWFWCWYDLDSDYHTPFHQPFILILMPLMFRFLERSIFSGMM